MKFAVAGAVVLLAYLVGALASAAAALLRRQGGGGPAEGASGQAAFAAAFSDLFRGEQRKARLLPVIPALLCGGAALLLWGAAPVRLCRELAVALLLLAAGVTDAATHKIPNLLVGIAFLTGAVLLVWELLSPGARVGALVLTYGAGALCCAVLFYVLSRLTRDGIGMGDVKLIAAMGWLLGFMDTLLGVLAALLLCMGAAIPLLVWKKKNKSDTLPFGPFLFFGYMGILLLFNLK